jgi:hypothetical protein
LLKQTQQELKMSRIQLNDSARDIVVKMSEGNPGAMRVLMETITKGDPIDPESMLGGGLGSILAMDTYEIYGSDIWVLYKDVCHENLVEFVGILRGTQLGIISIHEIRKAMQEGVMADVRLIDVMAQVRSRLTKFQR